MGRDSSFFEPYTIKAGERFNIVVDAYFDYSDLRPRDFSVVVWADKEPVQLTNN